MAVHLDGSGAVDVAAHAAMHPGSELSHVVAFVVGGEQAGLVIERFEVLADGEISARDGSVGDAA